MTSRQKRAREIHRLIADVLRRNWDPIGVRDMPETKDEYDASAVFTGCWCRERVLVNSPNIWRKSKRRRWVLRTQIRRR